MTTEEAQRQLHSNPDFVNLKRYGYSLEAVAAQFPQGCPDKVIAQAMLITEDDVPAMKEAVMLKLRAAMKVKIDDAG